MALVFHIIIALLSLVFTTYLYFAPSAKKVRTAETLVALTLGSGLYLVFSKPANMLQVCMTGLVYLAVVSFGILAARHKLALEQPTN